ncbi:MAG: hypothetical protein WCY05_07140 [Candidatus Omnitrophota bacterium]
MKIKSFKTALLFLVLFCLSTKISASQANFDSQEIRDPFHIPEGVEEISAENATLKIPFVVNLKGVIIDGDKKYAIMNDSIVKEKDLWQGMIIEKIEKDYINVNYEGKKIQIPLVKKEG